MQTENRFFDDLARLATGAVGSLSGLRQEIETRVREQFDRLISRMDLVTREEFDAVQAMASKARLEQEQMARRLAILEEKLGVTSSASPDASDSDADSSAPKSPTQPTFIEVTDIPDASPGVV